MICHRTPELRTEYYYTSIILDSISSKSPVEQSSQVVCLFFDKINKIL
jgi:hypothetical protein